MEKHFWNEATCQTCEPRVRDHSTSHPYLSSQRCGVDIVKISEQASKSVGPTGRDRKHPS